MLRVTLRGVQGHLVRFLLTAFSVTLGVALVTGTFVLRDSIDTTLASLLNTASKGLDVSVRGVDAKTQTIEGDSRVPLPLTLGDTLAAVDGVARATPDIQGQALIADADGIVVRNGGAPGLAFPFRADDPSFTLSKGRAPIGPDEIVVEASTLKKSRLSVGDQTKAVIGNATRTVTITGEVTFGALFGATAILLDEAVARQAFAPDGKVGSFTLTAKPGVSQDVLKHRVDSVLPANAEAVTGEAIKKQNESSVQTGLGYVTTFLLIFAGISLFVGAFIIINTFSMVVAQRSRELALLRAVGASRRQVFRVVIGESLVIGLLGSIIGIVAGLGLTSLLQTLARTFIGIDISGGLPLHARTIVWSLLVGTLVTVVSAILPARRASRILPVAAMRDDATPAPRSLLVRGLVGGVLVIGGAALVAFAVTRHDIPWLLVGFGAPAVVIGALIGAPLATRPVVRVVAFPFVVGGGVVGRLARENALRVPRRTANTASALMIGLALISGLSVVAQSLKASLADIVTRDLTADYVLSAGGQSPVPSSVAPAVAKLPGVKSVAEFSAIGVKVGSFSDFAGAVDAQGLTDSIRITMRSGSPAALDKGQVLVNESTAKAQHWTVGQTLTGVTIGTLTNQSVTIGGVFKDSQALNTPLIVGRAAYTAGVPQGRQFDSGVYVTAAAGADKAALRSALVGVVKPYLVVSVEDGAEYANSAASGVDFILNLFVILLALSIVIAFLGIVNTLALSVFERTREIGLLRAVGLGRAKLAGMITIEAITTALFGAVLGTVLGLGLGIAGQRGLSSQGLTVLAIPWSTIITVLVVSALAGVVAAILPAIRAVRLDVLRAIATE